MCRWLVIGYIPVDLFVHGRSSWCCLSYALLYMFSAARRKPFQRESAYFIIAVSQERGRISQQHVLGFSLEVESFAVFGSVVQKMTAHLYLTRLLPHGSDSYVSCKWRELMCTSVQPSVKSNRVIAFTSLTLSLALISNGLRNNILHLFLWQIALRS